MPESTFADDPRLLSVASTIASGETVDWTTVPADPETTTVLDELRTLEGLCRAAEPIPDAWGPFAISGELGHGSYGTVYRAIDKNLNLPIALKVIRPVAPADREACAVALDEARLLAQINHPNVVRIYGAEQLGDEVGISMELVRGRTLDRMVRELGPFNADEAMLIGIDLCRAAAAVHAAGLLHGDIKANNVMRAQGGRTVLMDFGAGRDLKAAADRSGRRTIGTPAYLAPEVLEGGKPTRASDIYSLGVLLFYLVTGKHPVHGDTQTTVARQHSGATARRLHELRPGLPASFVHIVERATAERPAERYATAGELEAAIARAVRHEESAPAPAPLVSRLKPYFLAAAVTVAILGLGYLGWRQSGAGAPEPQTAVTSTASAPAAAPAADAYRIEAAFYRQQGGAPVRLQPGARVAPGDLLSLEVRSSVPTYVYVVNEDDQGASFLLFPLPGQQLTNPLKPGERHEIPGIVNGTRVTWEVSTAGGREHFLVFATPEPPSPAFERMFANLPPPSLGAPALAQPLSGDLVGALRGVGGLAKAPARPSGVKLSDDYAVPLPDGEETARGVWVRQLTLENPGK